MGKSDTFLLIGGFFVLVIGGYLTYNYVFKGNVATAGALGANTVAQNQALTFLGAATGAGLGSYIAAQS